MTKTATVIGDIYDAWRTQDVEWLASYLPESREARASEGGNDRAS